MPGRAYSAGSQYRYGFNGKENDNEVKGAGNQQDYGMRIYDPRLGKFLSVDPISKDYPELTTFQFASNRPIDGIDLDGLEFVEYGYPESRIRERYMKAKTKEDWEKLERQDRRGMFIAAGMLGAGFLGAGIVTYGPTVVLTTLRVATSKALVSTISSTSIIAARYGPDIANFVYGAVSGDATEPVPSTNGSGAADAGVSLRNLFKKGNAILDFFGGSISRFKNGVSIDKVADFKSGGFKGTIEQFTELFKGNKFTAIVAENPYESYDYLKSAAELLGQGGTITVRGTGSNKYFNKLLNGTMEGLDKFTEVSRKQIEPIGKTTSGVAIESKEYYEIILKRN